MKKSDVTVGATYVAKVSGKLARVRIERESPYGGWDATNVDTGRRVRIKSAQRLRRPIGPKGAQAIAAAERENARLREERERSPDGLTASERAMAADALDPDVCATIGCDQPATLTYLGRPRCQECYEDDVAVNEAPSNEENDMATKKTSRKAKKTTRSRTKPKASRRPEVNPTVEIITGQPLPGTTKARSKKARADKPTRISALDAAAQVLEKAGQPMNAQTMIAAMAEQGLWESPNGKTPHATLYAAILREIGAKGDAARFRKADRGLFEYAG